jgi:YD repeat-containing protein
MIASFYNRRLRSRLSSVGRTTSYGYDALSRQIAISNLAVQSAPLLQQAYTPDGPLASLTDANNHTTSFAYDGFDRLATTTYPLGSMEVLGYDADGNVLTRQTRAGQIISFAYDTLNRLTTKTPPSPAAVVSYGYDLAGPPHQPQRHQRRHRRHRAAVAGHVGPVRHQHWL